MKFSLEDLRKNVQTEFNKIREAINVREQLLLRQLDVICNSNQSYLNKNNITTTICTTHDLNKTNGSYNNNKNNDIDEIKFISDTEIILGLIRNFGKFNLENVNVNFTNLLYINEDEPEHDTPTMVKCLENVTKMTNVTVTTPSTANRTGNGGDVDYNDENIDVTTYLNDNNLNEEKVVIDFSNNRKYITENVSNLNESVINITLNEAKELIEKSSNVLQPLELVKDKQSNSSNGHSKSITPVSQNRSIVLSSTSTSNVTKTTIESKKQKKSLKLKPKITINNCNGVINLKNISSLTINCANKDLMNVNQNVSQSEPIDDGDSIAESQQIYSVTENGENSATENDEFLSEASDNNTTLNGSNTTTTKDNENYVNCEFYNRLIAEIKNTLKQQQHHHAKAHAHVHNMNNEDNNGNENNNANDNENNNYIDPIHVEELQLSAGESSTTLTTSNTNNSSSNTKTNSVKSRKLLLKNLENLKIILEKSEDDSSNGNEASGNKQPGRPVQIEQWLAEIISETEIEPMLNSEILELSKIQSGTLTSTCGKSNASTS